MASTWILVLIIVGLNGTPSASTVEFNSETSCSNAQSKIEKKFRDIQKMRRSSAFKIMSTRRRDPKMDSRLMRRIKITEIQITICVKK